MKNLVTRKQWGARPAKHIDPLSPSAIKFLVVHYSASDADEQADHANCASRVKGIQRYHMDTQGWSDIAYNWLVCKHGYIFRGRGWAVRSAATGPANSFTVAVCFLGDDTKNRNDAGPAGRDAIREVWRFVCRNGPNVEAGRGHRDFMSTSCPGDELYAFAHSLRKPAA